MARFLGREDLLQAALEFELMFVTLGGALGFNAPFVKHVLDGLVNALC
jgi:hypothetical protein